MPFVYDLTEIGEADDSDRPPPAEKFVYLPAPDYTGVGTPVRFSILPLEPADLRRLAEPSPQLPGRRSFLDRLLRRGPSAESRQQVQLHFEGHKYRSKLRQQQLFSIMVPALRAVGLRRAYCRYDGGCDEGFAWLDFYEMEGGTRVQDDVLGPRLHEMNIRHKLSAAGLMVGAGSSEQDNLASFAGVRLSNEWASILLGTSFGTGEYLIHGRPR